MSLTNQRRIILLGIVCLLAGLATAARADECVGGDRVRSVNQWGRPATTFSPRPVTTMEGLQEGFVTYRDDIVSVLTQAGWEGDPADLFAAVASGEGVTRVAAPQGTEFEWMAFRKRGKPACVKDIIWVARDPFAAWQVEVESNGASYVFLIPHDCLNVGLVSKGPAAEMQPDPACDLTATYDAEAGLIRVSGSTDGSGMMIDGLRIAGSPGDMGQLESAGPGSWTLKPTMEGRYEFSATAKNAYGQKTCSTAVDVAWPKPVCRIDASVDPNTGVVTIDSAGSQGDVELTGLTLHDGSAGDLATVEVGSAGRWTYDAGAYLPKRPGDYSYGFNAVSRLGDAEAVCSTSALVIKEGYDPRWIVRAFGLRADGDDQVMTSLVNTTGVPERTKLALGAGTGVGAAIEYLFNKRIGLEGAAMIADLDGTFVFDRGNEWEMDNEDVGFTAFTLGLNFHLTPDRRADLFIGPFVGLTDFDDATFTAFGETFRRDFEGDDLSFGINLGLDVPFGWESPWAFTTGVRYLAATAETRVAGEEIELDVDPLIFGAGLAYRFK